MGQNQRIIHRDACHPPPAWNVCSQSVQVTASACVRLHRAALPFKETALGTNSPSSLSAYPACPATIPTMKIGIMPIACAITLLTGCGPADQYATFIPKVLRQPSTEPPQPDPEQNVREWVRANAHTLFTARPSALAVARPRRITGRGFSVCVKAIVA